MGYDWKKSADETANAESIPPGEHAVRVVKVLYGKKDGSKFFTKNGDPQAMIILADDQAREAGLMLTFSDKAAWKLAQVLEAAGVNLEPMTRDGVTPDRFANEAFGTAQLMDRQLRIRVKYKKDSAYPEITPLRRAPGQSAAAPVTVPAEDDIPL